MSLSEEQLDRYARQLVMPEFPAAVQEKLLSSQVLIHGRGFSMNLCTLYLAAAGVGRLHISSRDPGLDKLVKRVAALNQDSLATQSGHALLPDMVLDFTQDVGPSGARRVAGAIGSGFPVIVALRARGAALVRRFQAGDPCPGCVLNAAGIGVTELIPDTDNGMAGPAAAALAIGELAGYMRPSRRTIVLDPVYGRFEDMEVGPVENCVLCGILSGRP